MSEPTTAQQTAQATLDSVVSPTQQTLDAQSSNPPSNPNPTSAPNFSPADMMNAINALPERIANAVKEATATPVTPPAQPAAARQTQQATTNKPGEMSFGEWWGGK